MIITRLDFFIERYLNSLLSSFTLDNELLLMLHLNTKLSAVACL